MASKRQWEQLRNLDKLATKASKGTFRERYLKQEINKLRKEMGLPPIEVPSRLSGPYADPGADKKLPDSLPADTKLSADLGAVQSLFDVEGDNP